MRTRRLRPVRPARPARSRLPMLPVLVVFGLLLFVMAAVAVSGPQVTGLPLAPERTAPPTPIPQQPDGLELPANTPDAESTGGWDRPPTVLLVLARAIAAAAAVAIVILGIVLAVRLIRVVRAAASARAALRVDTAEADMADMADDTAAPDPASDSLRRAGRVAVRAGLEALGDDDADPRRAVIACWMRLEAAAAAIGIERAPTDTPGDLAARMAAAHRIDPDLLSEFARLYHLARYSPDDVAESMRGEAGVLLRRLRAELDD